MINIIGANNEDQRITMTLALWLSTKLEDHFFGHNPLFKKLQLTNQIIRGGFGTEIRVPIKYPQGIGPKVEGVKDPYAPMSHKPQGNITHSKWQVAQYRMPISAPDRELVLQGSLTKKLSYLDSIMEASTDEFMNVLRAATMAAPNGDGAEGNDYTLASLRALFNKGGGSTTGPYSPAPHADQLGNAVGSGVTKVGGIERNAAGNAYFCVPVINPGTAATMGKTVINQLVTRSTRGADKADIIIVTADHYDVLMGILQSQRFITESKLSEFGFEAFSWRGCDVIFDDDVPTAEPGVNAFAINTKALKLAVLSMEPEVKKTEAPEQSIEAWKANWFGQLLMTKMGRGSGARHANLNA